MFLLYTSHAKFKHYMGTSVMSMLIVSKPGSQTNPMAIFTLMDWYTLKLTGFDKMNMDIIDFYKPKWISLRI